MTSYRIIRDTSHELRRRIHRALTDTPDADFGLSTPEQDISLSAPESGGDKQPLLSVYLYRIEPDTSMRSQHELPSGPPTSRVPPLLLQLHYLITALNPDEERNQLVLGRLLQHFHEEPALDLPGSPQTGERFDGRSPLLEVVLEIPTLEDQSRLWSGLQAGYRPSICYCVRVIAIDAA